MGCAGDRLRYIVITQDQLRWDATDKVEKGRRMQYDDTLNDPGPPQEWWTHKGHKQRRKAMRRGRGHAAAFEYAGRMRRGEIRTALLAELSEAPGHGYDLIQRLQGRRGGGSGGEARAAGH